MRTFHLHYTEALIRRAVWAFWRRVVGWRFGVALALLLASFVASVGSGDRSWKVGAEGSMLCLGVAFGVVLYFAHYRGAITRFRRMRVPEATFEAGEDRFRMTSDVGSSEFGWGTITEVWRFPDFWLLFFSKAQFFTLPLADLDDKDRAFILARVAAHGAKVS